MGDTIAAYDYTAATGALTPRQTVPTLPADFKGENTAAEIRVHPNGKFLYGSNRGHDSLAVFAIDPATGLLTPIEIVASGGKTPRNFALSPDGAWLVCATKIPATSPCFASTPRPAGSRASPAKPPCRCASVSCFTTEWFATINPA